MSRVHSLVVVSVHGMKPACRLLFAALSPSSRRLRYKDGLGGGVQAI